MGAPDPAAERPGLLRAAYEALNRGSVDAFCDLLFDPDVLTVDAGLGTLVGVEAVAAEHRRLLAGFPDLCWRVEDVFCVGDRTLTRLVATGTHAGTWQGWAPTGQVVRLHACESDEWVGTRVVTRQLYWDRQAVLDQLHR